MAITDRLLTEVASASRRYVAALGERVVRAELSVADVRRMIDPRLCDQGTEATGVIRELVHLGGRATVATAGPRYFGFVNGGLCLPRLPPSSLPLPGTRMRQWRS